jgi:hypothetical protein
MTNRPTWHDKTTAMEKRLTLMSFLSLFLIVTLPVVHLVSRVLGKSILSGDTVTDTCRDDL